MNDIVKIASSTADYLLQKLNQQQPNSKPIEQGKTQSYPSPLLPSGYASYDQYKQTGSWGKPSIADRPEPKSVLSYDSDSTNKSFAPVQKELANASSLRDKYKLNPSEIVDIDLGKYANSKFIPQHLTKTLIGKAAGYALTKGDYFGAITFLCEGVYPKAFYYDPASGGRRGTLVNTHPGITLSLQPENTIRGIFANTSLRDMTDEIVAKSLGKGASKGISGNMASARLQVSDYYHMFQRIEGTYSKGTYNALAGRLSSHPMAKQLLAKGMDKAEVMEEIQSNLSPASYSVLQQLAYKYGNGGIKKFGKLLDYTINAALNPDNADKHLANGAKHIVYQYMNGKKQWVQDTRVMNIHRLFFLSGEKFSPEMNLKLITGGKLDADEEKIVKEVAKKAGVSSIIKDGKLDLPDSTPESKKHSVTPKFNEAAIRKGTTVVNQDFKPVDIEPKISKDDVEQTVKQAQALANTTATIKPKAPRVGVNTNHMIADFMQLN